MVQVAGAKLFSEDEQSCVGVYLQVKGFSGSLEAGDCMRSLYWLDKVSSGLYLYDETNKTNKKKKTANP